MQLSKIVLANMMINNQIILEEDYDEGYAPTKEGNIQCAQIVFLILIAYG